MVPAILPCCARADAGSSIRNAANATNTLIQADIGASFNRLGYWPGGSGEGVGDTARLRVRYAGRELGPA
jgi:hypothetical protein